MEKAIEIKRRAQRFIQGGDLDGALHEYEKLVNFPDCDPYNFVLLADLLFKRGEMPGAIERYLSAAALYEKSALYKNAIAVCKKMMRLSLAPAQVLEQLANLHALDGLGTEAALYYRQFAEHLVREQRGAEAAVALRKAFTATPEETSLLERVAEAHLLAGENEAAAKAMAQASYEYRQRGRDELSAASRARAEEISPGTWNQFVAEIAPDLVADPAGDNGFVHESDEADESIPQLIANPGPKAEPQEPADLELGSRSLDEPDVPEEMPVIRTSDERSLDDLPPESQAPELEGPMGFSVTPPSLQPDPSRDHPPVAPTGRRSGRPPNPAEIDGLLKHAQEAMRAGEQEAASRNLMEAARAYEASGRFDNAATIYRSVVRTTSSPIEVLERWLANAERRDARNEAAEVACQLGDYSLAAGDTKAAGEWFRHASRLDENNSTAQRRLKRLEPEAAPPAGPPMQVPIEKAGPPTQTPVTASAPAGGASAAPQEGAAAAAGSAPKVEMALGRAEAVSFDLGSLLGEFQRGIEEQLSGDAQGHYDLAMAYREMGLLDLAIESFRMAKTSPALLARATEMMGRSLLDQGRFEDAIQELSQGLARSDLDADAILGLRYLLGLAFEASGRLNEALTEFEFVLSQQPSFQDAGQKANNLRKALGS